MDCPVLVLLSWLVSVCCRQRARGRLRVQVCACVRIFRVSCNLHDIGNEVVGFGSVCVSVCMYVCVYVLVCIMQIRLSYIHSCHCVTEDTVLKVCILPKKKGVAMLKEQNNNNPSCQNMNNE